MKPRPRDIALFSRLGQRTGHVKPHQVFLTAFQNIPVNEAWRGNGGSRRTSGRTQNTEAAQYFRMQGRAQETARKPCGKAGAG